MVYLGKRCRGRCRRALGYLFPPVVRNRYSTGTWTFHRSFGIFDVLRKFNDHSIGFFSFDAQVRAWYRINRDYPTHEMLEHNKSIL